MQNKTSPLHYLFVSFKIHHSKPGTGDENDNFLALVSWKCVHY